MKKFNAFDPVLIRCSSMEEWSADFYDRFNSEHDEHCTITGTLVRDDNILPYNEETKYLHNTVGELTKWIPKKGEPILVRDSINATWVIRIFLEICEDRYKCTGYPEKGCDNNYSMWNLAKPYINPFEE